MLALALCTVYILIINYIDFGCYYRDEIMNWDRL
jgi:hypothetical protein